MIDHVRKLIQGMTKESALIKELKELIGSQKELILSNKIPEFMSNVSLQEELLDKIRAFERERIVILDTVGRELNLDHTPTVKEIITYAPDSEKVRLSFIRKKFITLSEEVKHLNVENRYMIKKSLAYVQKHLKLLKNFTKSDYVYSMNGGYGKVLTPVNRLIDRSV